MSPEDNLYSRLQDDKTWRIRELSELVRACKDASSSRQGALLRAAVPLLYAHWEGYFVLAANSYLVFVTEKRISISDLKDEFWVLSMRKKYKASQIKSDRFFSNFLLELKKEKDSVFKVGKYERINGQSNLNSEVLDFCCRCIGIQYSSFAAYSNFIDRQLIDKRNFIAHGASLKFDAENVSAYRDKVVDLMRITQNEIENSVASAAYLR